MKKGMLTRILVGTVLTALFAGIWLSGIWQFGKILQTVLCGITALLCVYEMTHVLNKAGYKFFSAPMYLLAAAASPLIAYFRFEIYWAVLFICAVLTVFVRITNKDERNEDMLASLLIYAYPLALLGVLFKVCNLESLQVNRLAMFITFACPLLGDTLAYFFGVTMGKRKLCEHISPKKTVAGSVGGILGGALAGLGAFYLQDGITALFNIDSPAGKTELIPLIVLGVILGAVGQIGDLFASCIKRWAGVKDYGSIFPGHGGMMDRIDSVLMCAPFVLMFFSIFGF